MSNPKPCPGIEIEPGVYTGCRAGATGATDCPICEHHPGEDHRWVHIEADLFGCAAGDTCNARGHSGPYGIERCESNHVR